MANQHGIGLGRIERAVSLKTKGLIANRSPAVQWQSSVKVLGLGCGNQGIYQFKAGFGCFASLGSIPQSFKINQVLGLVAGAVIS